MRRFVILGLALLGIALPCSSVRAKESAKEEAKALLAKAAELTNLCAPGSPPFRLRARVHFLDDKRAPVEGVYLLLWSSPDFWREELTWPDFSQVQIAARDRLWLKRNLPYLPLRAYRLSEAFNIPAQLRWRGADWKQVVLRQKKERKGLRRICVDEQDARSLWIVPLREVCVDPASNTVVSVSDWMRGGVRLEYEGYGAFGSHNFPRMLRIFREGRLLLQAQVEELEIVLGLNSRLFEPPKGATWRRWCADQTQPRLLGSTGSSVLLAGATSSSREWHFAAYFVLATDGRPYNLRALERTAEGPLGPPLLAAAENLRFEPAMCHGMPIEVEFVYEMGFPGLKPP